MSYILVLIAVILLAVQFTFNKLFQLRVGASVWASLFYSLSTGICTSIVFFAIGGFKPEFTLFSFVMALLSTLFSTIYTLIGFKIMEAGKFAIYMMFLMLGGMMLPYIFGVIFLDEKPSVLRIIGLVLLTAAIIIANLDTKKSESGKSSKKYILLCLSVFVLNGGVSIISKLHQIETTYKTVSAPSFVLIANLINVVVIAAILTVKGAWKKDAPAEIGAVTAKMTSAKTIVIICGAAIAGGTSYLFQLFGAAKLDASVLYPMVTGGSVVLSALSGYICFKEKLSAKNTVGIIIAFAATLLFLNF